MLQDMEAVTFSEVRAELGVVKPRITRTSSTRFTPRCTLAPARARHPEREIKEFGPPNGRQMEQKGMSISRIEGGKIVEEWQAYDNLSLMQQLGLVPEQ